MKSVLRIVFSGGFHNARAKTVLANIIGGEAYISERQAAGLRRHFCGGGCSCGGLLRASAELPSGWEKLSTAGNNIEPIACRTTGTQDYGIMLARVQASGRGATPAEVQRNVAALDTD